MKKPTAAVRRFGPSMAETLFAGGSTAVFLVILASVAEALMRYLQ